MERISLAGVELTAYLQQATALSSRPRRSGGNQFRHAMATLAVLVDYRYTSPVLLKAAVLHDLLEEIPSTDAAGIEAIDVDGPAVLRLVLELTRQADESKVAYLARLLQRASAQAKILKVADRISNLTDLHRSLFSHDYIERYLDLTTRYVLPMAWDSDPRMAEEVAELIERRRASLSSKDPPCV